MLCSFSRKYLPDIQVQITIAFQLFIQVKIINNVLREKQLVQLTTQTMAKVIFLETLYFVRQRKPIVHTSNCH